jgi:hypothetical protein
MTFCYIGLLTAIVLFAATFERLGPARLKRRLLSRYRILINVTINESIIVNGSGQGLGTDRQVLRHYRGDEFPEWEDCKHLQGDGGPGTVRCA